jgi:uncharacterized protein YbaP (TraB family)
MKFSAMLVGAVALSVCLGVASADAQSQAQFQVQAAQPTSPPSDDSAVITDLAPVQVELPGPALWRAKKGDSQVVIMGFFRPLPEHLEWKDARIAHALDGASVLLVPAEPKVGIGDLWSIAWNYNAFMLPAGKSLKDVLPPAEAEAYERLSHTGKPSPLPVDRLKPTAAAAVLLANQNRNLKLSVDKPVSTVKSLARKAHVPIREMGEIKVGALIRIGRGLTDTQQLDCFRLIMAEADWEAREMEAAAAAWASGDVKTLRAHRAERGRTSCTGEEANKSAFVEKGVRDVVSSISDALSKPGKSVALVDLDYLDAPNGVLDQLKADGVEISVPR